MRRSARLWILVLVLTACDGASAGPDASAPDTGLADTGTADATSGDAGLVRAPVGVYSEFLDATAVEATLPSLAARGAALSIAVPDERIGDPALRSLLAAAQAAGVEVRLWLLLSRDAGYWPNETNVATFAEAVIRLLDWVDAEGLAVSTVVYDLEPALAYSEELRAGFRGADLAALEALMRTHVDRAAFEAARDALAANVREVQARGVRAQAVTYPQVIDDALDGDPDLQDALDIPVDSVPFDEIAFMVYQTTFAEAQGSWIGSGLVRSYALDAVRTYGERATIALGIVGTAGVFEGMGEAYASPEVLRADVGAALGAGAARVEVYSLDGMVELGDVDGWLDATIAAPSAVPIPGAARIVRSAAQGLDDGLNAP